MSVRTRFAPVRPVICTLAAFGTAPVLLAVCPAATADNSSCGSTTPTSSGTSKRRWPRSCTACAGWGSTGTKGPEVGGPHAPYYQSQRLAALSGGGGEAAGRGAAYRDYATPEEIQVERERGRRPRSGRSSTAAAGWPRRPPSAPRFEAEGRQAVVRLKMPREGTLVIDDLVRGRVEFEWARRAGPRDPAGRRHLSLSPGQRGRRLRFRDHAT